MAVTRSVKLDWVAGTSGQTYLVEYKKDVDSTWITAVDNLTVLTYTISGLEPATLYNFRVTAHCSTGIDANPTPVNDLTEDYQCPPGYTLSPDKQSCILVETVPPEIIQSGICLAESNLSPEYGAQGTKLWQNINYNSTLTDSNFTLLTSDYWSGNPPGSGETVNGGDPPGSATPVPGSPASPMNRNGVWVDTNCDGIKNGLSSTDILQFSYQIISPTAKTVYIGVAADNNFTITLDNTVIASRNDSFGTSNFIYWYLFPISLVSGPNLINFRAQGDGSVNDAAGFVIYDNTAAQLMAATSDAQVNILFTAYSLIGGTPIDIATCPAGYTLNTSGGSGNYICEKITTVPST